MYAKHNFYDYVKITDVIIISREFRYFFALKPLKKIYIKKIKFTIVGQ